MSNMSSANKPKDLIRAEAAEWLARMHAGEADSAVLKEFEFWRNSNPQHDIAYEQCYSLWSMTNALKDDGELMAELHAAREIGQNAVPHQPTLLKRSLPWQASVAALCILLGMMIYWLAPITPETQMYSTQIGEQLRVQLDDGSTATLNTDSTIAVRYSQNKRLVELQQGEVYFDVAKQAHRPFEVLASGNTVRAVGTKFNVALVTQGVNVDVAEGIVAFQPKLAEAAARLHVGEAVRYRHGSESTAIVQAQLARINAWQEQKLYFESDLLADVVREYNRYIEEKIVVADKELNQQRITGIFRQGDLSSFLFSLQHALHARVERRGNIILVMKELEHAEG